MVEYTRGFEEFTRGFEEYTRGPVEYTCAPWTGALGPLTACACATGRGCRAGGVARAWRAAFSGAACSSSAAGAEWISAKPSARQKVSGIFIVGVELDRACGYLFNRVRRGELRRMGG